MRQRQLRRFAEQSLMAHMHPVKIANGHHRIGNEAGYIFCSSNNSHKTVLILPQTSYYSRPVKNHLKSSRIQSNDKYSHNLLK